MEFIGLPIWLWFGVAPLVAVATGVTYLTTPRLRPHAALRGLLMVSAGLAVAEVVAIVLVIALVILVSASGGLLPD